MSPICSNANPEFPIRSPAAPRGTVYGIAVLLVGATLVPYLNSFTAPFLFDDLKWIVNDPQVRDISSDWRRLDLGQRPVVFLSLAINYALGHLDVRGYHLFNFAVHAVAGLALFGIIRRTIDLRNGRSGRDLPAVSLAFTIALVWLVHPLQTQSVTYVIQRCESLMGMFFLLCLYCVIRGAQATRGWPWYSAALVACLLGLGCKEVMATAPAVILLYDRAFLSPSWRDAARRRGLLYVLLFGAALMLAAAMRSTILETEGSAGFGYKDVTPLAYLQTQPGVILYYLRLAVWPYPLCLDYAWQPATSPAEIYPPGAAVLALLAASLVAFRYRPWLGFLGLSFFLVLAPTSSIIPIRDMAVEHRMYLPLAPVVVLAVLIGFWFTERLVKDPTARQLARVGPVTIAVLVLAGLTMSRNLDYCDPLRIWTRVVAVAPHNSRGHFSVGANLNLQGDSQGAMACFERAIALAPDYARAHGNLGILRIGQGDLERGEEHLRRAIELKPNYATALTSLGNVSARQQNWRQAASYYRQALHSEPYHAEARRNLALALLRMDRPAEAIAVLREAVRLNPHATDVRLQLAWVLATSPDDRVRDGREAVRLAEEARHQAGNQHWPVWDALAAAYAEAGRFDDARRAASRCLDLARSARPEESLDEFETKLAMYRDGQPFRDTAVVSAVSVEGEIRDDD
jgi:tetratricopeptide (TPR) repeat protein